MNYIKVYMSPEQIKAVKEYAAIDNRAVSNFIYNAIEYKMSQSKKHRADGTLITFNG